MDAYRSYQKGPIEIRFMENEEERERALAEGRPYYLAVDIYVLKDGEILSKYHRNFERKVHFLHYENFIKKFLRDSTYRVNFLREREKNWEDTVDY